MDLDELMPVLFVGILERVRYFRHPTGVRSQPRDGEIVRMYL